MEPVDLLIARIAVRQHGLVTRRQLRVAGLTERQIERRLICGHLVAVHRGVYRVAAVPPTYEQAVQAACLASGGVASHRSAARLFRLRGFESAREIEVTVDAARAPNFEGVITHRSNTVGRTTIGTIPVAPPADVLLQLAAVSPRRLEGAVNDVLCRKLTTLPRLVRVLQQRAARGRGGTALLRDLVAEQVRQGAPTESWLEDRLVEFLRVRGFPEPVRQYRVQLPNRRIRLDLAWPEFLLDLEGDGRLFHTSPSARREDAERDQALDEVSWVVERVTWLELVEDPDAVDERLRRWFVAPARRIGKAA